jgi:hypothetical protein
MLFRNAKNTAWDKVESKTAYIRDPDNKRWIRLYPYNYYVRNSANTEWVLVDDVFNPTIDDPCEGVTAGVIGAACNAKPTDTLAGSGTGNGSGGAAWDEVAGYPSGYDLPDASLGGFGLIQNENTWPLGFQLKRPGARLFESYDPAGVAAQTGLGIYANPNLERSSAFGRGAAVTETVYAVGLEYGFIEIVYASYSEEGISLDVYYRGLRVASTCGRVTGRGRIKFPFESVESDERIMVRVRGSESTMWALQVLPQKATSYDDYKNLELNWYQTYDSTIAPDLLTIEYIGTPAFPAPCHAAVWPIADRIQDNKYFEYYHYMGENVGTVYLDYTSWANADFVEVYHNGRRLATTLDAKQGKGFLKFHYDPKDSGCYDVMVRVGSKDFTVNSVNSVYYSLYCVDTRGAREYRHPCGSYEVVSAGHPTTEDCFDLGTGFASDVCGVLIDLDAGSFDAKFEVFDENDVLLDTTNTNGIGTLEFWLPPSATQRRRIYVRVTSAIGSNWRYFVRCPIQKPVIQIPDYNVQHRCEEPFDGDGSFDWQRVAFAYTGTTLFNYEWDYGYEYAFMCSEPDESVFNTHMFDKVQSWSATKGSTTYNDSNARLYIPWADKKLDGWFYLSDHLEQNSKYHAVWFSADKVNPFDGGDVTMTAYWLFEVKEGGAFTMLTSGDENTTVTLSAYDKSSGSVGAVVKTISTSGGDRKTSNAITLSPGWYHVLTRVYNKGGVGYGGNPGFVGVNITRDADASLRVKMTTPVFPLFEQVTQPWNAEKKCGQSDILIPAGPNAVVTMYKDIANGAKAVRIDSAGGSLMHAIYRRRVRLTQNVSPFSHTWEKVALASDYVLEQPISPGYEYWAMFNNEVVFHSRMTNLLKGWQTAAQGYAYSRTYCLTEPHSLYSIWASKDGYNVDRVGKTYICPMYEFVAPMTGDYVVQAWGNDAPRFGIYEGAYVGDPTWDPSANNGIGGWPSFPYKTGELQGYTKVWYWYANEDDNYVKSTVHLEAGKKYTVRLLCHNYNGGNSYSAMRISMPGVQPVADDGSAYAFGSLSAHHLIVPDPQSQFSLPASPYGEVFASTGDNGKKSVHVGLSYGRPSSIIAMDGAGGVEWPGLVALYRRPLYPSMSDNDLSGWSVDARYTSYTDAVQQLPLSLQYNRDYYLYVVRDSDGHQMPDDSGVPAQMTSLTLTPLRALCSQYMHQSSKAWSDEDGVMAYADGVYATLGTYFKAAEVSGAHAIIYVLSRPCNVKV